jgi:hypothetical protein
MKTKIERNGIEYEIEVEQLPDRSITGGVFRDGKQIIKMDVSDDDSFDLKTYRGENASILVLRLLEDFTKSGFVIGGA